MVHRSSLVVVATLALAVAAQSARAADATMRISHQVPVAHHLHKAIEGFKVEVEKRTEGKIEVKIFPAEQIAKAAEHHPSVARGSLEAAVATNFQWGNTIPEMNVMTIPYLFTDLERIKKFPGSDAAKILEQKLEQKGVKNLAWFYITRQSIFTSGKKPIVQLADFRGMKIRGLSTISDAGLVAVGAAPTPMAAPEVYQALESGVLDAGITDVSAAVSRKFYEVQKFGTVAPYFSVYFHMFVNPAWWNKLTPAHRAALEASARKAEADMVTLTEETAAVAGKQLRERGMTIHDQTADEQKAWAAAMQKPVIDAFVKATGDDGRKLIDLLSKL